MKVGIFLIDLFKPLSVIYYNTNDWKVSLSTVVSVKIIASKPVICECWLQLENDCKLLKTVLRSEI